MGSRRFCLLLYWGGNIINGDQSWTYDKPHEGGIILKEGNSYSELVEKVYSAMNIDCTPSMLKMTCRCPLFVTTTTCNYFLHKIKDDESLKFAIATISNAPVVNAIDLYIEKVDLNYDVYPIGENLSLSRPCRSPPSTQCTPLSIDPLQHHDPINEGRLISLLGSTLRPSRSHNFSGTNKKCHKSSQPLPESMAGGEGGIDYDLDAEYRTGESVDSKFDGINKHLDCNFITSKIIHMVGVDPTFKIHDIVVFIKDQYGCKVSYWKAWKAKQKAIAILFGDWKESYAIMPRYLAAIKFNNEGTIHELRSNHFDGNYRIFDKNFWAFSGSIEGFVHCRPLISIDATHLRGNYNGKLFIAMAMDANEDIFPLAFGYGDDESYDTWHYFLKRLWYYVVKGREGICLLSDCHKSILAVINSDEEFQKPRTYHRFCMQHIHSNFISKCKPDQALRLLMWKAATAYQLPKFNHYMKKIKEYDEQQQNERKKPWKWLNEIPLEKWTFVHDGGHRYGVNSINISEVFNGVLIGARSLPVTASVQLIFHLIVTYFCQRRQQSVDRHANLEMEHTPFMTLKFEELKNKVKQYNVFRHNNSEGSAIVISGKGKVKNVNMKERTCTCGKWSIYKYPCSHVMAVCADLRLEPKYLIDPYLSLEAYVATFAPTINPALPKEYWKESIPSTASVLIPNPIMLRQKGRPSRHIHNEIDLSDRQHNNH